MLKKQAEMGSENYTNDRLSRAANEEDGYTDGSSSEQAKRALELQEEVKLGGSEINTEKMDIYIDQDGNLRGDPEIRELVKSKLQI